MHNKQVSHVSENIIVLFHYSQREQRVDYISSNNLINLSLILDFQCIDYNLPNEMYLFSSDTPHD